MGQGSILNLRTRCLGSLLVRFPGALRLKLDKGRLPNQGCGFLASLLTSLLSTCVVFTISHRREGLLTTRVLFPKTAPSERWCFWISGLHWTDWGTAVWAGDKASDEVSLENGLTILYWLLFDLYWSKYRKEGIVDKDLPLSNQPVDVCAGHFLGCSLMKESWTHCGWYHTWAGGPALYKKGGWAIQR